MVVLMGMGLGWVLGLVFAVLANRYVPYLADERPGILARFPETVDIRRTARMALGVLFLYWGIVGAVMGAVHNLTSVLFPLSMFGVRNALYPLAVLIVALAVGNFAAKRFLPARRDIWTLSAVFVILFAGLLPIFVNRG